MRIAKFFFLLIAISWITPANAQFGRNKPRYRTFDFKVLESPHFDIHHYLENDSLLDKLTQQSELWYKMHQSVLHDTFYHHNPIIFYNNHAEFQQTNAISGAIGVGTGGVTEAFKNRVVMPLTMTNQQTNHVLGHELVHAFQYDMVINGDSTSLRSFANIPLWMVEGLAEYMSIGRHDTHTAMWMRDAIINDYLPEIKDLHNPRFFPYRYGQAFWSFIAGYYGDNAIRPLFMTTAKYGFDLAVDSVFSISTDALSNMWQSALTTYYEPYVGDKKENFVGKKLISEENAGKINVSPSLSPNGRYVIFLSEKDLFSTDLFLAEARTGKIKKKIASSLKDGHIDALNALESSGTWSPNSKKFAFVAFHKGKHILIIKEAETGKTLESLPIPGLSAFTNPVWSPNGDEIIVSASVQGQTDLYAFDLRKKNVRQLTDNPYAEIQSAFSADGQTLVYSTDRRSFEEGRTHGKWTFDIAMLDLATGQETILPLFHGADNLNPSFDHEGNIYFLSNRDGYRNLYKYDRTDGAVYQMTDFLTGISGITKYSPAIGVSTKRDRVLFSHYYDQKYTIYQASSDQLLNRAVAADDLDFGAGTLPVVGLNKLDLINVNLDHIDNLRLADTSVFAEKPYSKKFRLDYISGGAGVGVNNNGLFSNTVGVAGAVNLIFSDMLGNNQLLTSLAVNGEIYDFGGSVTWLNRKNRLTYGAGISHIPQVLGSLSAPFFDTLAFDDGTRIQVINQEVNRLRIFEDNIGAFVHYPLSPNFRIEGGVGAGFRSFRWDVRNQYFDPITGFFIGEDRRTIDAPDTIQLTSLHRFIKGFSYSLNAGIVGDNSIFGLTAPIHGYRYQLRIAKFFGTDDYFSLIADYRRYHRMRPFTFAFRGMGVLKFEDEGDISTNPYYLGNMGLLHGFDLFFNSPFSSSFNDPDNPVSLNQLYGNKLLVANFEIRLPFTGPKQLALIGSNAIFSDLALFVDSGVAFDEFNELNDDSVAPIFVRTGVGLRINLFGALILEPYYSFRVRGGGSSGFGLNIVPGW